MLEAHPSSKSEGRANWLGTQGLGLELQKPSSMAQKAMSQEKDGADPKRENRYWSQLPDQEARPLDVATDDVSL